VKATIDGDFVVFTPQNETESQFLAEFPELNRRKLDKVLHEFLCGRLVEWQYHQEGVKRLEGHKGHDLYLQRMGSAIWCKTCEELL